MNAEILQQINRALVQGMDGLLLSSGETLTADQKPDTIDKVSDDQLPYLLFDVGKMSFAPWQFWEESVSWDVAVTLKVKAEPGEVDTAILGVVFDLIGQLKKLGGLPVDDNGKVVPYGPDTRKLFERDQLTTLVGRGAPYLKTFSARPSDGAYAVADLVIHLETTIDLDPRGKLPVAQVAILGVNAPAGSMGADSSLPDPYDIAIVSEQDERAWGGYNTPNPVDGSTATQSSAGPSQNEQVRSLNVTPYTASLSVGTPTQQLSAVLVMQSWASSYVTSVASWVSDTPSVATVSSTGLVTRVAAGTANISCSYMGAASNAVAVTCT